MDEASTVLEEAAKEVERIEVRAYSPSHPDRVYAQRIEGTRCVVFSEEFS
jgi:hypothetical protein